MKAAKRSFAVVAMPCLLGVGDEDVGNDYTMLIMRDCVSEEGRTMRVCARNDEQVVRWSESALRGVDM